MDPVPLIPKSNQPENHDVSHVIQEVFQDIIPLPQFPKNVAENATKYKLENQNLKSNSIKAIATCVGTKLSLDEIGDVEHNLMVGQGMFLKENDVIHKDEILTEFSKLQRRAVFPDLSLEPVRKYGLLQKIDLLPTKPERSMDFRINSNQHLCPLPCPSELDMYPTKLEKMERKRKHISHGRTRKNEKEEPEIIFKAIPKSIIFEDYKPGIAYEKQFKLKNVSRTTQAFIPRLLPKTSAFQVDLREGSTRLVPGMSAIFSVKYETDVYKDVQEVMTFYTYLVGCDIQVKLISRRRPPNLMVFVFKSFEHFEQNCLPVERFDLLEKSRTLALNYTIDCGGCLVGKQLKFSLILKNEGNIGQFFILSEDDWYFADISGVNKEMELITRTFHIYPTYFEIDTDELVELNITFFPVQFGLEVEKLFLICNNNTFEELEIVGDGILFDSNNIGIEAQRKYRNMNNMDAESEYFVDCGKLIPHQNRMFLITLHNNSVLNFVHKWKIRESVCHMQGTKLKKMDPSWIVSMNKQLDFLPADGTADLEVMLECKSKEPGIYSLVLTLHILDIPETSLIEDKAFSVLGTPRTSKHGKLETKVVDVIIGEVELLCEVTSVHIIFDPENITVPYIMSYEEAFTQKLQIRTDGCTSLDCKWKPTDLKCIEIDPMKFVLHPQTIFVCSISIWANTQEDIRDTLTLVINNGLCEKSYDVAAKVIKPVARFSETFLNFGYVAKGKTVDGKDFYVENVGQNMVDWEIFEFYFDHERNTICEIDVAKHVTFTNGKLEKNDCCKITYSVDSTDQHHRWLSFLILLSSHPTSEAMNSLCLITYEVTQPDIIIHSPLSQQPILYPGKLLYLGYTTFYTICLHNIGTKLPGSFIWGKPVGRQAKSIQIKCFPKSGIIQPQMCAHITISLLPQDTGIMDEVYIPCFVGNADEPLILTILCVVDDICLFIHLPDNNGGFEKVFWPPQTISDGEGFSLDLDQLEAEGEENDTRESTLNNTELHTLRSSFSSSIEQHAVTTKEIPQNEEVTENSELHLDIIQSSESGGSYAEIENDDWTPSTPSPSFPLKTYFDSDLILQDYWLEYRNIPLKTPVKKTIIIENVTPLYGNFVVEATNFCAQERNEEERNVMDDVLVKLKAKRRDEWEDSINADFGIVVKTTPTKGTVGPYISVEIDIWVYANTWGTYVEEILIEINQIQPFYFNLLMQVVGVPIEFPIALNSIIDDPVVRFGNIPYLSKPLQRKLKIRNFGCAPLCLVWRVFKYKENPLDVVEPFHSPTKMGQNNCDEDALKLPLTQYYGEEDFTIFNIEPREIHISSKSTEAITVTINTECFKPKFQQTPIQAYLIGHIHLAKEFASQSNVYTRPTGLDMLPAKVKFLATLELPLLKLELVKGDTCIRAYANDIIKETEMLYQRVLVFRNVNTAPAIIYMHTTSPFRIVSIKTAHTNTNKNATAAVVQPGECVEVLVECMVDKEEVLQYCDMLFNPKTVVFPEIPDFKLNSITLLRYLNIHQHGLRKQITSLECVLFYPKLLVSHEDIDFGVVFIGNTKKMMITLSNPTGSHVTFRMHHPITSSAVTIKPSKGVIPKANGTTPSKIMVTLYFIPGESRVYQEMIRIHTDMPFYSFTVNLTGSGSNDEKFYIAGK